MNYSITIDIARNPRVAYVDESLNTGVHELLSDHFDRVFADRPLRNRNDSVYAYSIIRDGLEVIVNPLYMNGQAAYALGCDEHTIVRDLRGAVNEVARMWRSAWSDEVQP